MKTNVYQAQEYDFEENKPNHPHELSKKEKAERTLLIATILVSALIIFSMSALVVLLAILDPYEVATALESEGYVDIAGLLREAADALSGR